MKFLDTLRDLYECRPKLRGWLRAAKGINTNLLTWAFVVMNKAADEHDEYERKMKPYLAVVGERMKAAGSTCWCILHDCDVSQCASEHDD